MVRSEKNPTPENQVKAQKEEKKIIVHSPRGKILMNGLAIFSILVRYFDSALCRHLLPEP